MNLSREATLSMLLSSLFGAKVDDLRIFLSHTCGSEILQHLPAGTASPFQVIAASVDVLQRRGALTATFFDALRGHFPGRASEIDVVSALWSSRPPSSVFFPPVVELKPIYSQQVLRVAWQFCLRFDTPIDLTPAGLIDVLRAASGSSDRKLFGYFTVYPRVFQPQVKAQFSREGPVLSWNCEVETGVRNRREDQHLRVDMNGVILVQRDVLCDQPMMDFEELAEDTPRFLRFARRLHADLGRRERLEVSVALMAEPAHEKTVFFGGIVRPRPMCQSIRYTDAAIAVERSIDPQRLDSLEGLSAQSHFLLESIASGFIFEPVMRLQDQHFDMLGVEQESVQRLIETRFGAHDSRSRSD